MKFLVLGSVSMLINDVALASSFSTGMPWESPIEKVTRFIAGPIPRGIGLVALTTAAVTWALGEGGTIVQCTAKLGVALAFGFNAASYILPMFGFAQGALLT